MNARCFIGLSGIISGKLIYCSRFSCVEQRGPSLYVSPAALWDAWVEENSSSQPRAVTVRWGGGGRTNKVTWSCDRARWRDTQLAARGSLALSEPPGLNLPGSSASSEPLGCLPTGLSKDLLEACDLGGAPRCMCSVLPVHRAVHAAGFMCTVLGVRCAVCTVLCTHSILGRLSYACVCTHRAGRVPCCRRAVLPVPRLLRAQQPLPGAQQHTEGQRASASICGSGAGEKTT